MARKSRLRMIVISLPTAVTGVASSALLLLGVDLNLTLTVSSLILGLTAFGAAEYGAYLTSRQSQVWVISGSRSVHAGVKLRGILDAIGSNSAISIRTLRPEKNETTLEDWVTAKYAWFRNTILQALSSGAQYLIVDMAEQAIDNIKGDLLEAGRSGRTVIILGDVAFPSVGTDAFCIVKADPAVGGLLAGQEMARLLREYGGATGVLIVRSFPANERPRAAYATLALALADKAGSTVLLTADSASEIGRLTDEIKAIGEQAQGAIIVACATDSQLVALSRMLKSTIPHLCERMCFIGYDGTLDENGDPLVLASPLHVHGTVDTRPYDQGRLAGEEVLRRVGGGRRNVQLVVPPTFQCLKESEVSPFLGA